MQVLSAHAVCFTLVGLIIQVPGSNPGEPDAVLLFRPEAGNSWRRLRSARDGPARRARAPRWAGRALALHQHRVRQPHPPEAPFERARRQPITDQSPGGPVDPQLARAARLSGAEGGLGGDGRGTAGSTCRS